MDYHLYIRRCMAMGKESLAYMYVYSYAYACVIHVVIKLALGMYVANNFI